VVGAKELGLTAIHAMNSGLVIAKSGRNDEPGRGRTWLTYLGTRRVVMPDVDPMAPASGARDDRATRFWAVTETSKSYAAYRLGPSTATEDAEGQNCGRV